MACRTELKSDASKYFGGMPVPQADEGSACDGEIFNIVDQLSHSDMKTMLFLCMTNLYDERSLNSYLQLVAQEKDLKYHFLKKWCEAKFGHHDLIELLGTMKKFKHLKHLGICRHVFKKQENTYKQIPEISKFFFSICEELDDEEVKSLQSGLFPEISKDICGEELVCLLFLHGKISHNDFSILKESLVTLNRDDLKSEIEAYEDKRIISSGDFYSIRQPTISNPSGLAVVINQKTFTKSKHEITEELCSEERKGSDIDCEKLCKLWQDFGFEVKIHENVTEERIFMLPETISHSDLSSFDILVICIMSHGKKGSFYSSDNLEINIDQFIDAVADVCMTKKPKLFFIQACQGDKHNEGVSVLPCRQGRRNLATDSRPVGDIAPRHSDILKAVATVPNYVCYRDEKDGSLFISHLVKNVTEFGDREDILSILTKVQNDISEENLPFDGELYKQQPVTTTTLRKKVLLKRAVTEVV